MSLSRGNRVGLSLFALAAILAARPAHADRTEHVATPALTELTDAIKAAEKSEKGRFISDGKATKSVGSALLDSGLKLTDEKDIPPSIKTIAEKVGAPMTPESLFKTVQMLKKQEAEDTIGIAARVLVDQLGPKAMRLFQKDGKTDGVELAKALTLPVDAKTGSVEKQRTDKVIELALTVPVGTQDAAPVPDKDKQEKKKGDSEKDAAPAPKEGGIKSKDGEKKDEEKLPPQGPVGPQEAFPQIDPGQLLDTPNVDALNDFLNNLRDQNDRRNDKQNAKVNDGDKQDSGSGGTPTPPPIGNPKLEKGEFKATTPPVVTTSFSSFEAPGGIADVALNPDLAAMLAGKGIYNPDGTRGGIGDILEMVAQNAKTRQDILSMVNFRQQAGMVNRSGLTTATPSGVPSIGTQLASGYGGGVSYGPRARNLPNIFAGANFGDARNPPQVGPRTPTNPSFLPGPTNTNGVPSVPTIALARRGGPVAETTAKAEAPVRPRFLNPGGVERPAGL